MLVFLSGIGDAGYLSSLGIESLVDLPAVGQNLHVSRLRPLYTIFRLTS